VSDPIQTPADALLYLDCLARFGGQDDVAAKFREIAAVVRGLCLRLEEQAMRNERAEAGKQVTT
jgi:hypothetical protein